MILGFAHITRNASPPWLEHKGLLAVANAPEKWPLMQRRAKWHYLRFDGDREETVEYDTGAVEGSPAKLAVVDGRIVVRAQYAKGERKFFREGLGFQAVNGDLVRLWSAMAQWQVVIAVEQWEGAPIDPPLDIEGYAALAFYSSNVEADRDKAIAAGGRTPTDPFTVKLDREMKIIMLRSPEGTIIELIEVKP